MVVHFWLVIISVCAYWLYSILDSTRHLTEGTLRSLRSANLRIGNKTPIRARQCFVISQRGGIEAQSITGKITSLPSAVLVDVFVCDQSETEDGHA